MTLRVKEAAASFLLLATFMLGCKFSGGANSNQPTQPANTNAGAANPFGHVQVADRGAK